MSPLIKKSMECVKGTLDTRAVWTLTVTIVFCLVVMAGMMPSAGSGGGDAEASLAYILTGGEKADRIDANAMVTGVIKQKNQMHLQQADDDMWTISKEEVYVLNDPFYPLEGDVGVLLNESGTLELKEAMITGRLYQDLTDIYQGTFTASTGSSGKVPTTTSIGTGGSVVMLEQVYQVGGVSYAKIKVANQSYDRLRPGMTFAENYQLSSIIDRETVEVMCGDEKYEIEVGVMRKI